MTTIQEQMAAFIHDTEYDALQADARDMAKLCVLDWLGSVYAGKGARPTCAGLTPPVNSVGEEPGRMSWLICVSKRMRLALKAVVYRLQGKTVRAIEALTSGLALDPLEPALKAEAERLNLHLAGQPPDPMEAAHFYLELGMWADARRELERIGHRTLMQQYLIGYCLFKLGDEAGWRAAFAAAAAMDVAGVFPSTFVEWCVLDHVIRNHLDPRAPFLLANLLFAKGRSNEAIALWEKAAPFLSDYSFVFRNLGFEIFGFEYGGFGGFRR